MKNPVSRLQLRVKICSIQFTGQIWGSKIHPSVFIYLSSEKLTSVCSLFSENFSPLLISVILKQERTALSHSIILGLMKAVTSKISNGTQSLSFIACIYSLGSIFNHLQIIFFCDLHNFIHLTGNSCIMDRYDRPGFLRNRSFDQIFIYIHGIRTDIHKYNPGSP